MTEVITPSRLSDLIGLIYDSALDRDRWPIAIEAIRLELDCANAVLALQSLDDGRAILNHATNIS